MRTPAQPDFSTVTVFAGLLGGSPDGMATGMHDVLKAFAGFGCLNGPGQQNRQPVTETARDDGKDDQKDDDGSALIDPNEFSQFVFLLLLGFLLLEFLRSLGLVTTIKAKSIIRDLDRIEIEGTDGARYSFDTTDGMFVGPKGGIDGFIEVIGPDGSRRYFLGK